jgi:hypothetical protein
MTNATSTVLVLATPLVLLAILPFGWLRSRLVFLALGIPIFLIVAILVFAGLFASGMAAGHGSGDSGGWDGFYPLLLWLVVGGFLLFGGVLGRPACRQPERTDPEETKLPTMREAQATDQNPNAQQAGSSNGGQRPS